MTPNISFCLIGKNEEKCMERCLRALSAYPIPILYTDTGSVDQTVDIVRKYTDHIHQFTWCDDFSKARNFCASKASTDWIWFLDCDETLVSADFTQLISFIENKKNATVIGTIQQKDAYTLSGSATYAITRLGRIYNRNYYQYTGAVHEQITPISDQLTCQYHDLPVLFHHDGYLTPDLLHQKCKRNIQLMENALIQKKDPYLYYQLGKAYSTIGDDKRALSAFQNGLSFDLDPSLFYVQSMVESYGYCMLNLKLYKDALSFESIYDTFAINADFVFLMGLIYMNNALFDEAIAQFKKATTFQTCVVEGTNSFRALYNIGVIYECLGDLQNAVSYYKKCNSYEPAKARLEVISNA